MKLYINAILLETTPYSAIPVLVIIFPAESSLYKPHKDRTYKRTRRSVGTQEDASKCILRPAQGVNFPNPRRQVEAITVHLNFNNTPSFRVRISLAAFNVKGEGKVIHVFFELNTTP